MAKQASNFQWLVVLSVVKSLGGGMVTTTFSSSGAVSNSSYNMHMAVSVVV